MSRLDELFNDKDSIIHVDVGDQVICDICDKDWTDSPVSGGYLFGSYGVCPDCATGDFNKNVERHKEQNHIRAYCPADMSHANWIREVVRR